MALAWTWTWLLVMIVTGSVSRPGTGWPTHLPAVLGPAIAALVVTAVYDGRAGVADLARRCVRWPGRWIWSVAAILAVGVLAAAVARALGEPWPSAESLGEFTGAPPLPWPVLAVYILIVNGYGEEIGWRGFVVHRLVEVTSQSRAWVITWALWALWHLPLFWVVASFREMRWEVLGWLLGLFAGAVVLGWLYVRSSSSILLVALWHTAYNFTAATEGTSGTIAAASSTVVMLAAVVIVVLEARRRPARR